MNSDRSPSADSQKIESVAQVAGGIAPALNNLLTVIKGQASMLLDDTSLSADSQERVKHIFTAGEKADNLIRQMLIFSRQQKPQVEVLDFNGHIEQTAAVLRRGLGEPIALEFKFTPHLPLILADPAMLEQALFILASNARDAMPHGGRLTVTTEEAEITESSAQGEPGHKPGEYVILRVDDDGEGIAPEILPRIFEPFFTTKVSDQSVGMGLTVALAIAQQHNGWMTANSSVSAGTKIKFFLPVAPLGSVVQPKLQPENEAQPSSQTMLLVEDDELVREFTVSVLKDYGYRVLQAGSGEDALEVWQWHGPRIRLLITDIVLEGNMSGLELATKLKAEKPQLKVICTSGHLRANVVKLPGYSPEYVLLQKPCRPQDLLTAVRTMLSDKTP